MRHCLATVSDEAFAAGTEVLLYSFLKHNRWFDGEVVVILGGELTAAARRRLEAVCPVRLLPPRRRVVERVHALTESIPELRVGSPRFHSLEIFGLEEYDRVLFVDSDAFFVGEVSELFERTGPLLACPDGATYDELLGELVETEAPARESRRQRYGADLENTFSAGVLAVGRELLSERVYRRLVARIDPATWREVAEVGWTDQLVLNRCLSDRCTLVDGRYNYMPILEETINQACGVTFFDARIIHMAGRLKPWHDVDPVELARSSPSMLKYVELWRALFAEVRARDDAQQARARLRDERHRMASLMKPRTEA